MCAEALMEHPYRALFAGKSKSGKTALAVKLINESWRNEIDRFMVFCPTWDQKAFDPIRDLVRRKEDIIQNYDKDPFPSLYRQLLNIKKKCIEKKYQMPRTLLLIDDMSGSKILHGGRLSAFAHLSIQSNHLSLSIFVLTQQVKSISPAFRDNLDGLIAFPMNREEDRDWLFKEYNGNMIRKKTFKKIIKTAWKGVGNEGYDRYGQHFLFVHLPVRAPTRYFSDFNHEITPRLKMNLPQHENMN